jgi:hypothetical protein
MHEQFVVSIQDLRFVALPCRHCSTRVTLDFNAEFEPDGKRAPFEAPKACPRCANPFDSAVPEAVNGMRKAWKALAGLGDGVTFVTGIPAPAPAAKGTP